MNKDKETKNQKMDKIIKELESKSSPKLFLLRRILLFSVYIFSTLTIILSFAWNIFRVENTLELSYVSVGVSLIFLATYNRLDRKISGDLLKKLNAVKNAMEDLNIEETNKTTVVTDVDGLEICLVTFFAVSKTPNPNIVLKISEKTKLIIVDNPVDPNEPWILLNKEMQDGKLFIRKETITEDEVKKLMDQKTFMKIINIRNELLESAGRNG